MDISVALTWFIKLTHMPKEENEGRESINIGRGERLSCRYPYLSSVDFLGVAVKYFPNLDLKLWDFLLNPLVI